MSQEITLGNLSSRQEQTLQSNADVPAAGSTTTGEKELPASTQREAMTGNSSSPQAVLFMTRVEVTKTNGERLQIELTEEYSEVVRRTTGARGGSHWSWMSPYGTLIVKIEDVSHMSITPNLIKHATPTDGNR